MPVFGWGKKTNNKHTQLQLLLILLFSLSLSQGMWMMGMIMIKRNWTQDRDKIDRVFSAIKTYKSPTWIVSYCEGTRMTKEKLLRVKHVYDGE